MNQYDYNHHFGLGHDEITMIFSFGTTFYSTFYHLNLLVRHQLKGDF